MLEIEKRLHQEQMAQSKFAIHRDKSFHEESKKINAKLHNQSIALDNKLHQV